MVRILFVIGVNNSLKLRLSTIQQKSGIMYQMSLHQLVWLIKKGIQNIHVYDLSDNQKQAKIHRQYNVVFVFILNMMELMKLNICHF